MAYPSDLRPIEPISIDDLDTAAPETGEPICERVDPKTLFVDPTYQRQISERGLRQIRRIIEAFDWTKYKPPICAYADHDGATVLKVLDGQHTAIAAASHPNIDMIPVMIVEAADTASQAAAFPVSDLGVPQPIITGIPHSTWEVGHAKDGDFVSGSYDPANVAVSRPSPATYFDAAGVMRTAANDVLRLDHDPATGEALGLLIEVAESNIVLQSDNLAGFGASNTTKTDSGIPSPIDGVNWQRYQVVATTQTTIACPVNAVPYATEIYSVYLRKGEGTGGLNRFGIYNRTTAKNVAFATINYDTGALAWNGPANGIMLAEPLGDNAWRVFLIPATGISVGDNVSVYAGAAGGLHTAGDVFYAAGAMLGKLPVPSSYIHAAGVAGSREADTLILLNTGVNDWTLTYNDGTEQIDGVDGNQVVPATGRRWLRSFSARPTNPPGGPTSLFSDESGYSQATVFGTFDAAAPQNAGQIVVNIFGAARNLRWSDWMSTYHETRGWRAWRYWEASDPVSVTRTIDGVEYTGQQYTLAISPPLREAVEAGQRIELARPRFVARFPRGFNLEWRVRGFWQSRPSLKFVEAEVR